MNKADTAEGNDPFQVGQTTEASAPTIIAHGDIRDNLLQYSSSLLELLVLCLCRM